MRIQHILIACLLFFCTFAVLVSMAFDIEKGYEVSNLDLTNDSNATQVINDLNIFEGQQEELMNISQKAPGMADADVQDTATTSGAITTSAWVTGIKFIGKALTMPNTIIRILGNFLSVDPRFLTTLIISLTIIVIFIIIGVPFFNKF